MDKKITDNIHGLCEKLSENIEIKNEKLMDDIKSLVISELKEVRNEIGEIKTEMKETMNKVQVTEDKIKDLEGQIKKLKLAKERSDLRWEIKVRMLNSNERSHGRRGGKLQRKK